MSRSLGLSLPLLSIALLSSAGALSAHREKTIVLNTRPSAQIKGVAQPFNPSQILAISASPNYVDSKNGYGNGDTTGGGDHKADDRSPEPSTIISFGSALLIGGGVFYSRRMRRIRK